MFRPLSNYEIRSRVLAPAKTALNFFHGEDENEEHLHVLLSSNSPGIGGVAISGSFQTILRSVVFHLP